MRCIVAPGNDCSECIDDVEGHPSAALTARAGYRLLLLNCTRHLIRLLARERMVNHICLLFVAHGCSKHCLAKPEQNTHNAARVLCRLELSTGRCSGNSSLQTSTGHLPQSYKWCRLRDVSDDTFYWQTFSTDTAALRQTPPHVRGFPALSCQHAMHMLEAAFLGHRHVQKLGWRQQISSM
jgi:hypothetical protein